MKKLLEKLYKARCKATLKKLGEVACVFESSTYVKYIKPGAKSNAQFKPMQTIYAAMGLVYGRKWEPTLLVTGFHISEDENNITVDIYSARPGCIIGKMGSLIDKLEEVLASAFKTKTKVLLHEEPKLYGMQIVEWYY